MKDRWELLDWGSVESILRSNARYQLLLRFHWEFYSELAFLRARIYDSLKSSLLERGAPFEFSRWQRAVKYKFSLEPLSTKGSRTDPGGRFNIGAIDTARFTVFPGLYIAQEKATALAELLGRDNDGQGQPLSAEELALTKPDSVTAVSVSGKLEAVFDVGKKENLAGFVNLIKDFRLSLGLRKRARTLGLPPPRLVRTSHEMARELLTPNWRAWPMRLDVPAPSQIFGQIIVDCGIEGIVYTSALTKKPCLVVYPQNFANSSSFVELDDPVPSEIVQKRIDSATFKNFL